MKKTLLAVTIPALFAVSANAATVYEKDGQKFDVYGRAQANIADKEAARLSGFDNTAEKTTLIGTGRIGLKGSTAINSQVSAFARGEWHVNAEQSSANEKDIDPATPGDQTQSNTKGQSFYARHLYVGFDGGQAGKVLFGQTDTAFYDTLAVTDYFNNWGDEAYASGRQEGQAIYSGSWGGYRASAGYQFADASQGLSNAYNASLGYTFDFGLGLGLGAESRNFDKNVGSNTTLDSNDRWAISTSYGTQGAPGFYAAALYTAATKSYYDGKADTDEQGWEFYGSYTTPNNWTFMGGYNRYYEKEQGADVVAYYVADVQYNFTSNFMSYLEYRLEDGKTAGVDNDDAVSLGLQYNF